MSAARAALAKRRPEGPVAARLSEADTRMERAPPKVQGGRE